MTDNIFMAILSKIKKINTQITNVSESVADVKSSLPTDYATQSSVDKIKTTIDGMSFGDAKEESVQAVLTKLDSVGGGSTASIVESSTQLATMTLATEYYSGTNERTIATFQIRNIEGTAKMLFTAAYGRTGVFKVYRNGALAHINYTSSTTSTNISVAVYVTHGDIIEFANYTSNSNNYVGVTSVSICGTLTGEGEVKLLSAAANSDT